MNDRDELSTGDAVKVYGPERIQIDAREDTELILIEVPSEYAPVGVWSR